MDGGGEFEHQNFEVKKKVRDTPTICLCLNCSDRHFLKRIWDNI